MHLECNNIGFIHIVLLLDFQISLTYQCLTYHQNTENNSHYSYRICHRTPQSRSTRFDSHLFQRLLCSTQSRCIRRCSAKDTYHIRQRNSQPITSQQCHQRTDQHYAYCQHIQLYTTCTERTEKARPYLQSQCIYEYHQTEALRIVQHLRVYGQSEMPGKDTCKEHERHSQRYTADMYLSQSQTNSRDQREHHNRLQGGMFNE